jgi:hypothetical protein
MAMEVPVVTTQVVAAGLCVDAMEPQLVIGHNAEEIAAGIMRLLGDAEERRRLSAEGAAGLPKRIAPGPTVRRNLRSCGWQPLRTTDPAKARSWSVPIDCRCVANGQENAKHMAISPDWAMRWVPVSKVNIW